MALAWNTLSGGQGAKPLSNPGQENLTFWVNHNGLEQIDIEGDVGFGDMARILLRRRANSTDIQKLRDRFTFAVQEMSRLALPEVYVAEFANGSLKWRQEPKDRAVTGAGQTRNIPVLIANRDADPIEVEARFSNASMSSRPPKVRIVPGATAGLFLRAVETHTGPQQGRLLLQAGTQQLQSPVLTEVRPMVPVRVRLLDESAGPTAARVYITGADGLSYAPRGSSARITAMSAEYYFHAEGAFQIRLPAGETMIEASRGPEYELARVPFTLAAGKPAEITVRLKRWTHMAAQGWYSADAHIHANYTSPYQQVVSPEDVRLQAQGEDLNNANMMVANSSGAFLHDLQYFEGKPNALSTPRHVLYWNEEMRNGGLYGHMVFFNLKSLVYPLYTGFRDTDFFEDYPANYTLAKGAQDQGGAVSYAHPGYQPTFEGASMREMPVDLALGQIDAMDVLSNNDEKATMTLYYRLLNCGFRLGISAGTDAFTNVADHYTMGGGRVYAEAGPALDYGAWVRAYKRGRTFASNGPVIDFTVDGRKPGDEIRGGVKTVRVRALVRSNIPLDAVDIVVNGKIVHSQSGLAVDQPVRLERSSWIAVRALGPRHRLVLNDEQTFAHTSPVYVYFGDQPIWLRDDLRFYVDWIEKLIQRTEEKGRFAAAERRAEVVALFRRALALYREREAKAL